MFLFKETNIKKYRSEIHLYGVSFLLALSFFYSTFSLFRFCYYLCLCIYTFLIAYRFVLDRKKIIDALIPFWLYGVLLLFFLYGLIVNSRIAEPIYLYKELSHGIIIAIPIVFIRMQASILLNKDRFWLICANFIIGMTLIISIVFFYKLIVTDLQRLVSIRRDYNFLALNLLFGLITLIYMSFKGKLKINSFIIQLFIVLIIANIVLLFSRRGIIAIIVIIGFLPLISVKVGLRIFLKKFWLIYLGVLVVITSLFAFILVSSDTRVKLFDMAGLDKATQGVIVKKTFRYYSVLYNGDYTYYKTLFLPKKANNTNFIIYENDTKKVELKQIYDLSPPFKADSAYLMDSSNTAYNYGENAFLSVPFDSSIYQINSGDTLVVSAYCYVSKKFDHEWSTIGIEAEGKIGTSYNLKSIGTWQFLTYTYTDISQVIAPKMMAALYGTSSFKKLNGYILFASPKLKFIKNKENNLAEIPTETIIIDKNSGLNNRFSRWLFAFRIWSFNYKWHEKIFGKGFTYINVFVKEFAVRENVDYPHNPIISSVLYSGILGGLFYIYFLGLSFLRYWRLRKELTLFALLYLLAFSFTMFSGNSHFSIPAFALLSLIPFVFEMPKNMKNETD